MSFVRVGIEHFLALAPAEDAGAQAAEQESQKWERIFQKIYRLFWRVLGL